MASVPAFQAFLDESNSPVFELNLDDSLRPYVTCCAIVPFDYHLPGRMAIPRSPTTGKYIKSSAREMTDSMAAECIKRVLATEIEIAIVGIDGGGAGSVKSAERLTSAANELRKDQNRPSIQPGSAIYLRAVWEALFRSIEIFYLRRSMLPSPLEVVFDNGNLKTKERDFISRNLQVVCGKYGLSVRNISWLSEQEQPLLLLPDIFAGVLRRQATHNDLPLAWEKVQTAIQAGRIVYKDGIASPNPRNVEKSEANIS
jgi:hypothetical protein